MIVFFFVNSCHNILWIISLFINAWDFLLSLLFDLLVANITILLCFFFLFHVVFNNFFKIPTEVENVRLKLALAIPTGAQITVVNNATEMLPLVVDKTCRDLWK